MRGWVIPLVRFLLKRKRAIADKCVYQINLMRGIRGTQIANSAFFGFSFSSQWRRDIRSDKNWSLSKARGSWQHLIIDMTLSYCGTFLFASYTFLLFIMSLTVEEELWGPFWIFDNSGIKRPNAHSIPSSCKNTLKLSARVSRKHYLDKSGSWETGRANGVWSDLWAGLQENKDPRVSHAMYESRLAAAIVSRNRLNSGGSDDQKKSRNVSGNELKTIDFFFLLRCKGQHPLDISSPNVTVRTMDGKGHSNDLAFTL